MSKDRMVKLLIFNAGLCLVNILLFSNAFFHIDMTGQNALTMALGVMTIVMSLSLFGYVNYKLLFPPPAPPPPPLTAARLATPDDCVQALTRYIQSNVATFSADLKAVIEQIRRMEKKKQTIRDILLERFSDTELSYGKFEGTVGEVEDIFMRNVRSLLKRVSAFDEGEYETALRGEAAHTRLAETRRAILNDYTTFVSRSVENNEEILLRLDRLILEISKLSDIHDGDVESLPAMRDLDALINDTKWYK